LAPRRQRPIPPASTPGRCFKRSTHYVRAITPSSTKRRSKIVGGPTNNANVGGKDPAVAALADGRIDLFVGYCSGAKRLLAQMPQLQVAEVPREVAAGPEYGLAVLKGSDPRTPDFALFMLSPSGQQIFADYGFAPVALPAQGH
jgi:molybdate transport system substrate-binding protein